MSTRAVTGLAEALALLQGLPQDITSKNGGVVARSLRKPARKVQQDLIQGAPFKTGRLQRAIVIVRDKNPEQVGASERIRVLVKPGKSRHDLKGAFYALAVEAKKPFFRPVVLAAREESTREFTEALQTGTQNALRKYRKRGA